MPKLGNCLEMYTCAQASVQFVHSMCTNLDTPCTLKLLHGHTLYTGAVYMLAHRLGHMCTCISKQFPSLGTPTFTAVIIPKILGGLKTLVSSFYTLKMVSEAISEHVILKKFLGEHAHTPSYKVLHAYACHHTPM